MPDHGPKRTYNLNALEFWFSRLGENWESYFIEDALDKGRDLYRNGEIREIELGEGDAVIHTKVESRDIYAVLDWTSDDLATRASVDDGVLGKALAVAGLYEIEELVIDEVSPVPPDATEIGNGNGHAPSNNGNGSRTDKTRRARPLILRFDTAPEGIVFKAFWMDGGGRRSPAHFNGNQNASQLAAKERETLIRLASLARKAHFRYLQEPSHYLLTDMTKTSTFLRNDLKGWRRYFTIELDVEVEKLKAGVQRVEVEARASSGIGDRLDLAWVFRTGEKMLTEHDAEALLRGNGKPVLLPDIGLVELAQPKLDAVRTWKTRTGKGSRDSLPKYLLFSLFSDERIHLQVTPEIQAWKDRVLCDPEPVEGLPDFLRNYQQKGVEWMAHLADRDCHSLLADEMGLGKTIQVISLMAVRPVEEPVQLVVAPASVIPVWEKEIRRFYPGMRIHILRGTCNFQTETSPGVWLASYAQMRRHRDLLDKVRFGYAILDEGQLIKNPEAKVTQACFSIQARHRLILTGTPLENRQLDLWSLFRFLMPGLLGNRANFEAAIETNRDLFVRRLRAQLAPFILRRTKRVVAAELPPKIEMNLVCPLTAVQRQEYARLCREGILRLGDDIRTTMRDRSFGLFSLLTRLRQVCCDPSLLPWLNEPLEASGKIDMLVEKLAEVLEGGHKVVIFSQFVRLLKRVEAALAQHFPSTKCFSLTGATVDRSAPVENFQNFSDPAVMLISLRAGGTGITLHSADYIFLLDPWWNPAVEEQAVDRVHRIGQTNTVFVYRMITSGTIEERIQALKDEKKTLFDNLIGDIGSVAAVKDTFEQLSSLIELGAEETEDEREAEAGHVL